MEATLENRQLLDVVLDRAPLLLVAFNGNGTLTLARGRVLKTLGMCEDELIGRPIFDVYGDTPAVEGMVRRALNGETFIEVHAIGLAWYETQFEPRCGSDGLVTGALAVSHEVTQRVDLERELEERSRTQAKLETLARRQAAVADLGRWSAPPEYRYS